ncbi:MAG: metal-dependent hydrolase, partial [Perlucidibaca sp.]
ENLRGLTALFGREGFLTKVLAGVPAYLADGFHPGQQQTQALEALWRDRLFSAQGSLAAEFSNRAAVA